MTWNYRVVAIEHDDEIEYGIYEVYYDGDTIIARTQDPVPVVGSGPEELAQVFQYMLLALNAPILTDKDFAHVEEA